MEMESDLQRDKEAYQIVEELGRLPLAIEQAGAYVREVTQSFAGFFDDYQTGQNELHKWLPDGNRQYSHSVATAWSMSFEFIKKESPQTASLFQYLSFLNP